MNEQEVDDRDLKALKARFSRALQIAFADVARPDFGRDERLVANYTACAQPLPHLALVAVHRRRVDMPIAQSQRFGDGARAFLPAQIPRAEAERGDARVLRCDEWRER